MSSSNGGHVGRSFDCCLEPDGKRKPLVAINGTHEIKRSWHVVPHGGYVVDAKSITDFSPRAAGLVTLAPGAAPVRSGRPR